MYCQCTVRGHITDPHGEFFVQVLYNYHTSLLTDDTMRILLPTHTTHHTPHTTQEDVRLDKESLQRDYFSSFWEAKFMLNV